MDIGPAGSAYLKYEHVGTGPGPNHRPIFCWTATSYDLISRVATLNLKAMLTQKSGADLRKDVG